jgi:hypothetical protein
MVYNNNKYFCNNTWNGTPYEWTWWSIYYDSSNEIWALDTWE